MANIQNQLTLCPRCKKLGIKFNSIVKKGLTNEQMYQCVYCHYVEYKASGQKLKNVSKNTSNNSVQIMALKPKIKFSKGGYNISDFIS